MTKEIVCNWRECRSADAATRELLRSAVDPGAVTEAVGSFFLEKSGVERPSFFPTGIPPRRLSGWELSCTGLPVSDDWRCVKFRCLLSGIDCDGERLRRAVAAFTAALPAFWIIGPGQPPVILAALRPIEEPKFSAATRAGRNVLQTSFPLCAAVAALPGIELR